MKNKYISELNNYLDELKVMKTRLTEIQSKIRKNKAVNSSQKILIWKAVDSSQHFIDLSAEFIFLTLKDNNY